MLSPEDFEAATGWTLKPQGLCREAACVPLPADGSWRDAEGRLDLTAFTARFGRPVVHDAEHAVWAFGESAEVRSERVLSLEAPDFTLPDLDGVLHSLSDFRGKKVFLTTWGSYCGCSYDLAVWQVLYDELKDKNFEIIAVALDAGGKAAVEKKASVRPTAEDLEARNPVLRPLQGWGEDEWNRASAPQYTCLIDEEHLLADLFSVTIVPMAVWIDEKGRIVRPAEVPGHSDWFRRYDHDTFEVPQGDVDVMVSNRHVYWDALRDWAEKGDASAFALSADELRARIHRPSEEEVRAALHAWIGAHLFGEGRWQAAKRHYEEAVRLAPGKWNYRRQSMVLEPELVGEFNVAPEFFAAQEALGTNAYFPTIDMPGITGPPPWLEKAES